MLTLHNVFIVLEDLSFYLLTSVIFKISQIFCSFFISFCLYAILLVELESFKQ